MKIRIGTTDADISVARAQALAGQLEDLGHQTQIMTYPNLGEAESIDQLRLGILRDDVDMVIHRLNRLPQKDVTGLVIAAVPLRDSNSDVLVARDRLTLSGLPDGAVVATGSRLRQAQLDQLHPGLTYVPLEPDLTTVLQRVRDGEIDALVTSSADIQALGRDEDVTDVLPTLTTPGQGALGYECRENDQDLVKVLETFDHQDTRVAVTAERAALAALDVSDEVSVAARAQRSGVLALRVDVVPHNGSRKLSVQLGMPTSEFHARIIGKRAAEALRRMGAEQIGRDLPADEGNAERPRPTKVSEARVLVAREEGPVTKELREAGATVESVTLQRRDVLNVSEDRLEGADWVAFTSERAVASVEDLGWKLPESARIAAVGRGTAAELERLGYTVDLVPEDVSDIDVLLEIWPDGEGTVKVPGSALLAPHFIPGLEAKGYDAELIPVYTLTQVPHAPVEIRHAWSEGQYDAIVVLSGSNALAVGQLLGWRADVPVIAVGESSTRVLDRAGVPIAAHIDSYQGSDIIDALRQALELTDEE